MKKLVAGACVALSVLVCAGTVMAESIERKLGVTGRLGFIAPSDSDFNNFKVNSDVGFVFGGGVIYGLSRKIALEFDTTYAMYGSELPDGRDMGDFDLLDFALGAQYRFADPYPNLTPYAGGGLNILVADYDGGDIDTGFGFHIKGGADFFIMKNLALNIELKAVIAPEIDIKNPGAAEGNYDPSNIAGTVGARYFF